MEKVNAYLINKVFTIPYIDRMVDENVAPESFLKCIGRYEKKEDYCVTQ